MVKKKSKLIISLCIAGILLIISLFFIFRNDKKDMSITVWNTDTMSFKKYSSYKKYELEDDLKNKQKNKEYQSKIGDSLLSKLYNVYIPGYNQFENELFKMEDGKIDNENLDWTAEIVKDIQYFTAGDFNSDGIEDVAQVFKYNGYGSGYSYVLVLFTSNSDDLRFLTKVDLGSNIVVNKIYYKDNIFYVDIITQGEGDDFLGYCCPNTPKSLRFVLEENELIEK